MKDSGQISLRAVTGLEVASVIASVLLSVWAIIPMQPPRRWLVYLPGVLAIALILYSHRVRGEKLSELGFTARYFGRALKLLSIPTLAACAILAATGYWNNSFHKTTHLWSTLLFLPIWGALQQYILQGFIYRRVRYLFVGDDPAPGRQGRVYLAIVTSAAVFALVHLPNPALTLLTLIGGLVWTWVYERAPNLFAIGLSHGMMSFLVMTSLPPWLLESMSVGYKHFLYQKF